MKKHTQQPVSALQAGAVTSHLIHGDLALARALGTGVSTVRLWRAKRLIPFVRTGHRSIAYNLNRVLAAIESLETRPQTAKGVRK